VRGPDRGAAAGDRDVIAEKRPQVPLVLLAAALVVGTIGYFRGLSHTVEPVGYGERRPVGRGPGAVGLAPSQAILGEGFQGANRGRLAQNLADLAARRRALTDEVGRPSEAEWDEAVATREEQRAYDGAPPTIPHAIDQRSRPNCLLCHRDGVTIEADLVAPAMSHDPAMTGCVQCHVTGGDPPVAGDGMAGGPPVATTFANDGRAGRGARAWPGAPPEVPHTTFLRERCASCHGVLASGLRTSHACQQSCEQCHAPAAGLDQVPRLSAAELPLAALPAGSGGPPPLRQPARPRRAGAQ
jgi:cytochrome c-type protein NapB